MHTNVHCSTVYNSKDLEPTQMPINDRLDRENVAHIHHGILCSHIKWWVHVLVGTWINLETIIQSKWTQEQKIKHSLIGGCWTMRTHGHREGSIIHWGLWGRTRVGTAVGRDNMGRNARYMWWGWRQQTTLPCMYLCNSPACYSYVPQNLKCNKIYIYKHTYKEIILDRWMNIIEQKVSYPTFRNPL